MNLKKKEGKKLQENQVKEPIVAYKRTIAKSLTIFNSFEEAEEDNYKWLASLTGEQHLQNAHELMKRILPTTLKSTPALATN